MGLTEWIANFGMQLIGGIGYVGIFLLMVAESMVLPVPSEAVMPFVGFLVAEGSLSPVWSVVAATLGSIAGSSLSYLIGRYGGKPFLTRYGKYLLLDAADLEATDRFFRKRGSLTILVARFIPIVRHLISIPAGMAEMQFAPFALFTVVGAGIWNAFLTFCGFILRRNWQTILGYSHVLDIVIVVALAALVVLYVARHLLRRRRAKAGRQ